MSPDALATADADIAADTGGFGADLPPGWARARLSDVASLNPSTDFDHLPGDAEIPFIPMAAVAQEIGKIDASQRRTVDGVRKGYVRFREGDVLFAKITPCMENGKTAPVLGMPGEYAAGSTEFHVLRPGCADTKYLWYWLVRRAFRQEAERNMSGSAGQLRVPVDYLRTASIPVAPLTEQRRIVARIDELFAEIAEGEAALERARRDLDTWRRALLKAAVSGELTRDWREANRPAENAGDLLARIVAERPSSSNERKRRNHVTTAMPDVSSLPALPCGWVWASFGRLFDISTGSTPSRSEPTFWDRGSIPWVSSGEVAFCRIKATRECITPVALGSSANRIHPPGTVLLAMIGEGKTRGQCAILDLAACNNQNAAAIRVSQTPIDPEFVYLILEERYLRSRKESQGGNQPALNAHKVAAIPIPLPPLTEIREIVRRTADLRNERENVELLLDGATAMRSQLQQSVLKAAFEGRLVPQDPTDEPASALLARLREERVGSRAAPRRRGGSSEAPQGALAI